MAFGLLGSIIPQINRNEILYTSVPSTLSIGKVSISSKNYNTAKVRIGITTDDINVEYLEYNRFLNYGETFETQNIHLGGTQKLVVRSDTTDVNFLFYGERINDSFNPVKSGMFNSILSTGTERKILYVCPLDYNATLTLSICNLDSLPVKARIGISDGNLNSFDSSEYLEYDVEIFPNQTYTRTDIKLQENQSLICSSNRNSLVSFVCHGSLQFINPSNEFVIDSSNQNVTFSAVNVTNFNVTNTSALYQNITGITTTPKLNVTGIATINYCNVTGISTTPKLNVTGIATVANINVTGIGTVNILNFSEIFGQSNVVITAFSSDVTLSQSSDSLIPTQSAIKQYVDNEIGITSTNSQIYSYFFSQSF